MGEQARSTFRALKDAGANPAMVDIYGPGHNADQRLIATYADALDPSLGDGVNIFSINADEVDDTLRALKDRNLFSPGSKNVIMPAWELERYPEEWARKLERFDEIWAMSQFTKESIEKSTYRPVIRMSQASEVGRRALRSRRYFGIRESAYAFFFAFDFLSYVERKNPFAVIDAFSAVLDQRPYADAVLVLKVNNSGQRPDMKLQFDKAIAGLDSRVLVIDKGLDDLEMKSLVWLIDCFVSLQRSEGFGRSISEAMALGKPVITTGYSGNMDFCTEDNVFLAPYELIPVAPGAYPHWENQRWADADPDAAAEIMTRLLDDPSIGIAKGKKARLDIRRDFSFIECGNGFWDRCKVLLERN